jgi:hypothetical protein
MAVGGCVPLAAPPKNGPAVNKKQTASRRSEFVFLLLFNRILLIPQPSTDILPLVGYGGSLLVESRKNGHFFRGIIWWNYLVGSTEFSRPPARPPVASRTRAPPRALGSGHPAPRAAPRSSIRRPLALFRCRRSTDRKRIERDL